MLSAELYDTTICVTPCKTMSLSGVPPIVITLFSLNCLFILEVDIIIAIKTPYLPIDLKNFLETLPVISSVAIISLSSLITGIS